jgi:glutathione S-transferase
MAIKLYGWFASAPALLIALILYEKNVPFEWIEVDITKGQSKSPDFIAKNPYGQVPTIVRL